eukprot:gene1315-792_t
MGGAERAALATGTRQGCPDHRHPCTQIPVYARRGTAADRERALAAAGLLKPWPERRG